MPSNCGRPTPAQRSLARLHLLRYGLLPRLLLFPLNHSIDSNCLSQVDWSDKFVFNVHARSIFPCDNMGIGVLFEYPACILEHGDRVRVFGKQRADVFSLVPPTTLHYVSERRVVPGQHSLHFDCELFSEKYVEYCFVYVSQAISGAVADVRMDCVPTLHGERKNWWRKANMQIQFY